MTLNARLLWSSAALLALGLSGVLAYQAWPLLFPQAEQRLVWDPECDLRAGPCQLPLPGGGQVSLGIEPRSIPVLQPLQLEVRVQGLEVSQVQVDFQGVDMNMGFNRVTLAPVGNGRFAGDGVLPVCVRSRMHWQAQVLLQTERGLVAADYRFWTGRPGVPAP